MIQNKVNEEILNTRNVPQVVAPTLHNPACREQLTSAARLVAQAVEKLVSSCQQAPDSAAAGVEQLVAAAQRVTDELERLLAHCHVGESWSWMNLR